LRDRRPRRTQQRQQRETPQRSGLKGRPQAGKEKDTISLAPVAVRPEFQKQGIGGELIREGLKVCLQLGYDSVIVLGHPEYYPKFGFEPASK